MAITLRLENHDATITFNFLSDIDVITGSQTFNISQGRVIETFRLIKKATTAATVRTAARELEDLLVQMTEWHEDVLKSDSVWIRRATEEEADKRSLVYGFEFRPVDNLVNDVFMQRTPAAVYDLAITRHAAYEDATSVSANKLTATDAIGGTWTATGLSGGAIPGRLAAMHFQTDDDIYRFWAGWRQMRGGSANFLPIIECEDGASSVTTGTTTGTDTQASPGGGGTTLLTTDFGVGGATMQRRFNIFFGDIYTTDATAEDQVGRYHVIFRSKVTNSDTKLGVKMVFGFSSGVFDTDAPQVHYEIQYIVPGHTNWGMYSLGTIDIPPGGLRKMATNKLGTGNVVRALQLRLHTERLEGTGDHEMDCFILVPADHSIFIDGITASIVVPDDIWVFTNENDTLSCYVEAPGTGTIIDFPAVADIGIDTWGYPQGGGFLVVAAERKTLSNWGDTFLRIDIDDLYKRYLNYNA